MRRLSWAPLLCLLFSAGESAVITGACERDLQCGGGMCCAISLWIQSLRMCTPMGNFGEDCHPLSHKMCGNTDVKFTQALWSHCGQIWFNVCCLSFQIRGLGYSGPIATELRQIPFWGKRMHHSCPCLPNLACVRIAPSKYECLPEFKNEDVFF